MGGESFTNLFLNKSTFLCLKCCFCTLFASSVNTKLSVNLLLDELFIMLFDFSMVLGGFVFGDLLKCSLDNLLWLVEVDIKTFVIDLYY
ncbi:hypothetical protein C1Y26_28250 [Pseudomonas sp. MPR-R2A7]|nr:hypothetical protein C1Y23_10895 [Pseudomonas sp. GW460-12]PMX35255.1 hypothetical protein C1Y26_28250 [Pseudomonas sp. MPR-R2A7]PMX37086.1 hypothetical protein C1Y24_03540 [Pseudomonas sp. MPR-R2A4]PMX55273.1 hypothetical protein C1Y17_03620 [Pseudomonas sp. MPR-R2A6]PMX92781.1 hypothetical protein C1Y21_05315 [Pseudomonas sp. MPR-R2A3]PMY10490.1 hypothetical protein C1Y22_22095 [Pseudomonas sp. MPR-R2A5]PNA22737.1 hypothetical protein C1Y16_30525 [Pseudomonas sp. MPR-ANB1]PNA50502.1 hyp